MELIIYYRLHKCNFKIDLIIIKSVLNLSWVLFADVAHRCSWFGWFERLEGAVGLGQRQISLHVGVGSRGCSCLGAIRRHLHFKQFALLPLFGILALARSVALHLVPLVVCGLSWGQAGLHSPYSVFKVSFFFFLLLLHLQGFGLEHREFRDSSQHLSRKLCCASLVLVDLFSDFQGALSPIKSLLSKFLSQVADFFINQLLLQQ